MGFQGIPPEWLKKLHMQEEIIKMAEGLYERAGSPLRGLAKSAFQPAPDRR